MGAVIIMFIKVGHSIISEFFFLLVLFLFDWPKKNQHQQALKAYLTFMCKKQKCYDENFVIFLIF